MKNSNKKLTTSEFIKKAILIHGKKYNYKKINYINNRTNICIICPIHGEYWQRPSHHLSSHRCYLCGLKKQTSDRTKSLTEILNQFKKTHNDRYCYSKVNYINSFKKVIIICKKHGEFLQTPDHHKRGIGCPKCIRRISKGEIEFLNYLKIPNTTENRQKYINSHNIHVDGINENIIYEFLGDYFHGNPEKFNNKKYNKICHKTYGELYKKTFKRFKKLKNSGYIIKYIWENDWNKFKKKITKFPKIMTY